MNEYLESYQSELRVQSRDCRKQMNDGCDRCVSGCLCNFCAWVIGFGIISIMTFIPLLFLTGYNCNSEVIYLEQWNKCTLSFVPVVVIFGIWFSFMVLMIINYCCRKYKNTLPVNDLPETQPLIQ